MAATPKCDTGEHRFRDRLGALTEQVRRIRIKDATARTLTARICPDCGGWHLLP